MIYRGTGKNKSTSPLVFGGPGRGTRGFAGRTERPIGRMATVRGTKKKKSEYEKRGKSLHQGELYLPRQQKNNLKIRIKKENKTLMGKCWE